MIPLPPECQAPDDLYARREKAGIDESARGIAVGIVTYNNPVSQLARLLGSGERLASLDLSQRLESTIDFAAPEATQRRVDERLMQIYPV